MMKNKRISLLILLGFLLALSASAQNRASTRLVSTGTKYSARYLPPGDPNLDPTWDWRPTPAQLANVNGHPIYYKTRTSSAIVADHVQVPFQTNGHPLADAINNGAKDMQPADGWMLVYRDFGTPMSAPELPFFVLYNKYRGILRVMVNNRDGLAYSAYKMSLSFRASSPREALMTFTSDNHTTLDNYNGLKTSDPHQVDSFIGNTTQYGGWFYGDFVLFGYDPSISNDAVMHIRLVGIDKSSIVLNSTAFTLDEVLSGNSPGGAGGGWDGTKFFNSFESVRKAAASSPFTKVKEAATAASALTAIPLITSVLDFVSLFIGGGDKASPREPMKFKGVLNMSGGIEQSQPIWEKDFALSVNKTDDPILYRPVQTIPWGVFNLNNRPEYTMSFYEGWDYYHDETYTYYTQYNSLYDLAQPLTYTVNPNIGLTLQSVEVATDYHNNFMPLADFNLARFEVSEDYRNNYYLNNIPRNLTLKLTFLINSPVINSSQTIVVFKDLGLNRPASANRSAGMAAPTKAIKEKKVRPLVVTVSPNPVVEQARILLNNPAGEPITVRVRNVIGQEVWQRTDTKAQPGGMQFMWDNRGPSGEKLPAGAYFIEVTTPTQRKTQRVVLQ